MRNPTSYIFNIFILFLVFIVLSISSFVSQYPALLAGGIGFICTALFVYYIIHSFNRLDKRIDHWFEDIEGIREDVFIIKEKEKESITREQILDKYYPKERTEFRDAILKAMEEYRNSHHF